MELFILLHAAFGTYVKISGERVSTIIPTFKVRSRTGRKCSRS